MKQRTAVLAPNFEIFMRYCRENKVENATFISNYLKLRGVYWDKVIIIEEASYQMLSEVHALRGLGRVKIIEKVEQ